MCYGGLIGRESFTFIFCVVLCFVQGILSIDICSKGTSAKELTSVLHPGALPKGGFQAGNFSKDTKATKLSKCILSCCSQDTCDAVFFFHNPKQDSDTCYLIQCNKTYPRSCDPGDPASTSNRTYFVNVRSVEYSQGGSAPSALEGSCNILGQPSGCREHEECRVRPTPSSYITECICTKGYTYDQDKDICVRDANHPPVAQVMGPKTMFMPVDSILLNGSNSTDDIMIVEYNWKQIKGNKLDIKDPKAAVTVATGDIQNGAYEFVLTVRDAEHMSSADSYTVTVSEQKKTTTICDPEKPECSKNEECYVPHALSSSMGICVCTKGYEKNQDGICESVIPNHTSSPSQHHFKLRQCEYGLLLQCDDYQECYIPRHSHSRIGTCRCIEGYQFDANHQCILIANSTVLPVTSISVHHKRQCEYGIIDQCDDYEECFIPADSHSRIGICVCLDGFQRDDNYTCVNISLGDIDLTAAKRNKSLSPSTPTTTTVASTTQKIIQLTVSAGENKVIQLPKNEVTLNAYVISKGDEESKFDYEWVLLSMPDGKEIGNMVGKNTDTLQLSKLVEGLYTFKIHITGPHQDGEAFVNVTVLPPARLNTPPVAVIKPVNQVVKLPNSAILDGSDSTDDDKIVKYQWEEKSGPLQEHQLKDDTAMLTLKDLAPGSYLFELTVTDSDGASNSTVANVTVIKETDYPPKANAGSDVVIRLPQTSVILNGNMSTDDKGIKEYEWMKSADDKLTADMTGVRTPYLHLSNLQEGDYMFTLKVTDTTGQTSSADVHVFVKPDTNHPPVAQVIGPKTMFMPVDSIVLNGSNSTDDKGIVLYSWEQIKGNRLNIKDPKAAVTVATGDIRNRVYEFVLTVRDAEHTSSTISYVVTISELPNTKPEANAGKDQVLTLPVDLVKLDGSKSSDDKGIASYSWTREPTSLAAGDPLNGSDHQAVLQLVNMVAGQYTFRLTVVDAEGLSASDTASVRVEENPHEKDLIELDLETDIRQFTEKDKSNLQSQLQLLLPNGDKSNVILDRLEEDTQSSLMKVFFHVQYSKDSKLNKSGEAISQLLKEKMRAAGNQLLSYNVANLDTIVCQNNCSGHGHCYKKTRKCICDAFWMENFLKTLILHDDSNCDWSILYFIIVTFLIVVVFASIVWGFICWFKNKRCRFRWRTKKRHRYSLLQDTDYKDEIKLLPKGKTQNSSMMISESDFTSDEETLFVNHKKNGFIKKPPNGINKQHLKNKMKA